jgi:3-deoxy-D-manno-octulosonic acid kinase
VIEKIQQGKQTVWVDSEWLGSADPIRCCDVRYWQQQSLITGSAQGRGTTWFIQLHKLEAALRHYRRGGIFGKLVKDHYLYTSLEQTRSYQEFCLLQQLRKAGVNVPRPIAAQVIKRTFCYQADLLSEKVPNAQDLVDVLSFDAISVLLYKKIGAQIRKMHNCQVNHTDLNIHNILLDSDENIWIIDFDKCYQVELSKSPRWKDANLERLLRSFEKEFVRGGIHWNKDQDWSALLAGYQTPQ